MPRSHEKLKIWNHRFADFIGRVRPPLTVLLLLAALVAFGLGISHVDAQPTPGDSVATTTARIPFADGFDYPVGKPDGKGYYKARGFRPNGHLGDDWNGLGGGNSDLGAPIYCAGNGIVVQARDVRLGWGNVVIVRHAYRQQGVVKIVDSLYGHLQKVLVKEGQILRKGDQVGTMGTNRGMYLCHLHFEIRKNIRLGMDRSLFARDFSNYWNPSQFIALHRKLPGSTGIASVPVDTFSKTRTFALPVDESSLKGGQAPRRKSTSSSSSSSSKKSSDGKSRTNRLILEVDRVQDMLKDL